MSERTETQATLMSESERETRRQEIIARLKELSRTVEGGSTENEMRLQEALVLEKELHQIDPVRSGAQTEVKEERRSNSGNREAIERLLKEAKKSSKE